MQLTAPMDIYCERLGPELLAEPINLISNLSFILAAYFAGRNLPPGAPTGLRRLVASAYAVGVGSALYHSFAQYWAMWADVVPIVVFLVSFLAYFLKNVLNFGIQKCVLGLGLFFAVSTLFITLINPMWVNGSNSYFGVVIALWALGFLCWQRKIKNYQTFFVAAFLFALSLLFRSIDMAVCPNFSLGTHFLWHSLNGLIIYLVLVRLVALRTNESA